MPAHINGSLAPLRHRGFCAIGWAVGLVAFVSACETPSADTEGLEALASCEYVNQFSELAECREYLGSDWTLELAAEDCDLQEGDFAEGSCVRDNPFGTCVLEGGTPSVYQVVIPSSDETDCEGSEVGCEVFGGGAFVAAEACGGLPDRDLQQGLVFVTPEKICLAAPDGSVGNGPDGTVCAWSQIGGCAEEGQRFVANTPEDRELLEAFEANEQVGTSGSVRSRGERLEFEPEDVLVHRLKLEP